MLFNNFIIFVKILNPTSMRKLNILKRCIDLAFYLYFFKTLLIAIFTPMVLLGFVSKISSKYYSEDIYFDDWQTKLILTFVLIACLFFVYTIYLIRKTVRLFIDGYIFSDDVISNLQKIGFLCYCLHFIH